MWFGENLMLSDDVVEIFPTKWSIILILQCEMWTRNSLIWTLLTIVSKAQWTFFGDLRIQFLIVFSDLTHYKSLSFVKDLYLRVKKKLKLAFHKGHHIISKLLSIPTTCQFRQIPFIFTRYTFECHTLIQSSLFHTHIHVYKRYQCNGSEAISCTLFRLYLHTHFQWS